MNDATPAGYENAPATKMVATFCACCGKELVDAKSLESGMGPHCRKKHGFNAELSAPSAEAAARVIKSALAGGLVLTEGDLADPRKVANRIVYRIAAEQDSVASRHLAAAVWHLGLTKLAGILAKRLGGVVVTQEGDELVIKAPYDPNVGYRMSRAGALWHKETKTRRAPLSARESVFHALIDAYPGALLIGTKNAAVIPPMSARR